MRNNQPVTNQEYVLREGAAIISRTDSKGRIVDCNLEFIEASGYTRDELIGQPHNMVRHPDMPEEAFRDFRDTLKRGRPWSQDIIDSGVQGCAALLAGLKTLVETGKALPSPF